MQPCKFLMYIVCFSDAITLSDLNNPSDLRWQIKTEFLGIKETGQWGSCKYDFLFLLSFQGNQQYMQQ